MIDSIQIRDFRGIRWGEVDGFKQLNLLVGPNNSGKSTLLEAIYLGCTAGQPAHWEGDSFEPAQVSLSGRDFLGDLPLLRVLKRHRYHLRKAGQGPYRDGCLNISISSPAAPLRRFQLHVPDLPILPDSLRDMDSKISRIEIDEGAQVALFACASGRDAGRAERALAGRILQLLSPTQGAGSTRQKTVQSGHKTPSGPNKQRRTAQRGARPSSGTAGPGQQTAIPRRPPAAQHCIYLWYPDLTYHSAGVAAWSLTGKLASPEHVLFFDVSNTHYHFYKTFLRDTMTRVPGWTYKIADCLREVLGIARSFDFHVQFLPAKDNDSLIQGWIAPRDQPALPIDAYGDGTRTALKILASLLSLVEQATADSPAVLLWEEPELFQNPRMLNRLLREIARLIEGKPLQLFMTTHSLEVVACVAMLVREGLLPADSLRAFRFSLEEGTLRSSWFHADNLLSWLERGMDPRIWDTLGVPLQFTLKEQEEGAE
ncbi:MAG: AAA family ATPase [Myxococcales bacterium]|nr:AAA family ATPase [Myxococcota bacterium]MDW8284335.1 AAA family ATPase [Myxococcales bacterium]